MNSIARFSLTLGLSFLAFTGFSQKIRFKIEGAKDTTVFLTKYWGKRLYYEDTAVMKDGVAEFNAKPGLKPGMLALSMPGQKFLEFVYNKEEINIEAKAPDFVTSTVVKKSVENKIFMPYVQYLNTQRTKANALTDKRKGLKATDAEYIVLTKQVDDISKEVIAYQKKLIADNPTSLTAKIVKMSMEIDLPEPPKNDKGVITDSSYVFRYFRAHFWDNTDLTDDRLVNTSIFENKLEQYLGKTMISQHPDSIIAYAIPFCNRLPKGTDMFKFCVDNITNTYGKSNVMGMDKVYLWMLSNYYCKRDDKGKSLAFWMEESKLESACEDLDIKMKLVQGVRPPNVILPDTTDVKWHDFYSLKSEYTILYFWDPECGHCKKTTPKLQTLYEKKLKARNVEVFAVGKATDTDFEKWKKFIRDNNLTFINVGLTKSLFEKVEHDAGPLIRSGQTTLESLNYHTTYDLYATPRIFLLDKDKKIIAKQLTISQLEDLLDHLQKKEDSEKLFPYDPEEEAH